MKSRYDLSIPCTCSQRKAGTEGDCKRHVPIAWVPPSEGDDA